MSKKMKIVLEQKSAKYIVKKLVNLTEPKIGSTLSKVEVERLLEAEDLTVEIVLKKK